MTLLSTERTSLFLVAVYPPRSRATRSEGAKSTVSGRGSGWLLRLTARSASAGVASSAPG